MDAVVGMKPVARNEFRKGIEAAKKGVGKGRLPDAVLDLLPLLHLFRTGDDHLFAGGRLIDDALGIGLPTTRRIDVFAVHAGMHGDGITRLGEFGGTLDRA